MANKKFRGVNGAVEISGLTEDFENAKRFDTVWVGELGVYYKSGFKTMFIAYSELDRVFIRVQEVNGKLCCGKASFFYYRLVFVVNGKEYSEGMTENEELFDEALALIGEKAPAVALGVARKDDAE